MRIRIPVLSALFLASLLAASAVADDIVWLKNGDRFSGRIVRKDDDKLLLILSFGGEARIPLKDIRSFKSDRPLEITLADGKEHAGPVDGGADACVTIQDEDNNDFKRVDVAEIEKLEDPNAKPAYWTSKLFFSAKMETGNSRSRDAWVDAKVVGDWSRERLTLEGAYDYGKNKGTVTDQSAYGQAKFDYFLTEKRRSYVFAKSRIRHDKFQDLSYRWTSGPGVGYRLLKDPDGVTLEADVGMDWVKENRRGGARDTSYVAANLAVRGRWVIVDGLTFSIESIWVQDIEESRDYFSDSWAALDLRVIKGLSLTAKVVWEYENETPPGVEHSDWTYLLGFTWTPF